MGDNISADKTRDLLYFNDFKQEAAGDNTWRNLYFLMLVLGSFLIGFLIYQANLYSEERKFDEVNTRVWYLVVNLIFAFFFYGYTRRSISRTILPGFSNSDARANFGSNYVKSILWIGLVLLPLSPAFVFIEVWDKIYLIFRKLFKGDQEELDQEKLDNIKSSLSSYLPFLKTVNLDRASRFTYLFGSFSYDRDDSASMFKDGTDIVRTPVLICSFFVTLCLLVPVAITAANGESLDKEWMNNIAPVSAAISGLVLVFVLGTLQGYGDTVTAERQRKYDVPLSKKN